MADLKQLARQIFHQTLTAIDIPATMRRKLQVEGTLLRFGDAKVNLRAFTRIHVVAIGKAAHAMVDGLRAVLPPETKLDGIVSALTPASHPAKHFRYFVAGHPTPNGQSLDAAKAILEPLKGYDEQTLLFFLLSGGGSALVEWPLCEKAKLQDVQQFYAALVTCGASITEINAVRKHLSAIKGGRVAVAAARATKITLAVSDVPVGHESALASGPTLPDPSTIADVEQILAKYKLRESLPITLRQWIDQGKMPETPKGGHHGFANAHFVLLLGLDDLFHPAHHASEAKGFITVCDNSTDDWPVEKAANFLLEQLERWKSANPGKRVALIADGEVSSRVTGNGIGGRNSAFVLSCVEKIAGKRIAVLSAGTDGIDGNSPAAGAVADGEALARAHALRLDAHHAFQQSDAFTFFSKLNDSIVTGPTGNNLRDLRILLAEP
jgi:glycerate 2-kinase